MDKKYEELFNFRTQNEDYFKLFNIQMQIFQYDQFSKRLDNIENDLKELNSKVSNIDKNFATFKTNFYWIISILIVLILAAPHIPLANLSKIVHYFLPFIK
jgi:archaellum component FlaC